MKVAIIGVGCSKFGELWEMGFRDIMISAGVEALEDANLEGREIEAIYVGNMSAGRYIGQEHIASLIADYSGLADLHVPCVRVEAGDASGGVALREAYMAVASGLHDVVIAAGAEKVTDVPNAMEILSSCADVEWEVFNGANLPALYAMIARAHMKRYGTREEDLAMVSVKNHKNATLNPKAMFRREISLETALNSPYVAEPLKLFDCSPICDGASVVILASDDVARRYTDTPVYIEACTQASDYLALQSRRDITTMDSVVHAYRQAYNIAGIEPKDVDVVEVHDSFTIAEIIAYEDLGFVEKGKGPSL